MSGGRNIEFLGKNKIENLQLNVTINKITQWMIWHMAQKKNIFRLKCGDTKHGK